MKSSFVSELDLGKTGDSSSLSKKVRAVTAIPSVLLSAALGLDLFNNSSNLLADEPEVSRVAVSKFKIPIFERVTSEVCYVGLSESQSHPKVIVSRQS